MSDKPRYPLAEAEALAETLLVFLRPFCERIIIAGSIRRKKPTVGDVELLFIPRAEQRPRDLFGATESVDLVAEKLEELIAAGILAKRLSATGAPTWGPKNKLAKHCDSGIPIDLFATTSDCWHNALVVRTGPASSNQLIAQVASARGLRWNAYGPGFTDASTGRIIPVTSEREVFDQLGLPYREPQHRQ